MFGPWVPHPTARSGPGCAVRWVTSLLWPGHVRRAGALAGVIVAAPVAMLVVAVSTVWAQVDSLHGGTILVGGVALAAGDLAMTMLLTAAIVGACWVRPSAGHPGRMGTRALLMMSVSAVALGAAIVVGSLAVLHAANLGWQRDPWALVVPVIAWLAGCLVLGPPALFIVVPHAVAWRALLRRAAAAMPPGGP